LTTTPSGSAFSPYPQPPQASDPYGQQPYEAYGRPAGAGALGPGVAPPADAAPAGPPGRRRSGPRWPSLVALALAAGLVGSGSTAAVLAAQDDGVAGSGSASVSTSDERDAAAGDAAAAIGTGTAPDWETVAAVVEPSVVAISARTQFGAGQGSGVILDEQGHVLTNNHVVADAAANGRLGVSLSDGRVFDAEVVGLDPATDLAVLLITDAPNDLVPIEVGDSEAVAVGQPVMAVGNPLGLSDTVTTGIVSATDRPVTTQATSGGAAFGAAAEPVVTNAIQTDAAVNPGNSGGALVDAAGRLIGINSSIASMPVGQGQSAGSIGLGFAIPANLAADVAQELLEDGTAEHAWLGVSLSIEQQVAQEGGVSRQAAVVGDVSAGTPAQEAGLRAGDAVVAIDGEPVNGAESLTAQVRDRRPGDQVTVDVVRDGQRTGVDVQLGVRP
jgi:putative serine protease PepD